MASKKKSPTTLQLRSVAPASRCAVNDPVNERYIHHAGCMVHLQPHALASPQTQRLHARTARRDAGTRISDFASSTRPVHGSGHTESRMDCTLIYASRHTGSLTLITCQCQFTVSLKLDSQLQPVYAVKAPLQRHHVSYSRSVVTFHTGRGVLYEGVYAPLKSRP